MYRRQFLSATTSTLAASQLSFAVNHTQNKKPNILMIIGDDCTYSDLSLYGGKNVNTPNIDHLASEGITFNHAYLSMAMCQPCRSELYTGLYPVRNGCCWNHSASIPGTKSIVHHLRDLNYRVGISNKIHVKPESVYPFDNAPGVTGGAVGKTTSVEPDGLKKYMMQNTDQPFCLIAGLVVPHVPWTVGDPSHFKLDELKLPPYLADTQQTRIDYARYLAEIKVMDQQVGSIIQALEESGQADNTIVIFTSEQGAQFPGCKWTNWDQGVHTGFVMKWANHIKPGTRTDAMIQYADVLPTLLDAVGGHVEENQFNGTSFLPLLINDKNEHREYAYFMHNNIPEGPPYPIRSVRNKDFHYIHNLRNEELYIERHLFGVVEHNPYWVTWTNKAADNPHTYNMVKRYMQRPEEEFYVSDDDKHELDNRIADPKHQKVIALLKNELRNWMDEQGDPGADLDQWSVYRARRRQDGVQR